MCIGTASKRPGSCYLLQGILVFRVSRAVYYWCIKTTYAKKATTNFEDALILSCLSKRKLALIKYADSSKRC
jgi:hypothetical protein